MQGDVTSATLTGRAPFVQRHPTVNLSSIHHQYWDYCRRLSPSDEEVSWRPANQPLPSLAEVSQASFSQLHSCVVVSMSSCTSKRTHSVRTKVR